eukprot:417174_1
MMAPPNTTNYTQLSKEMLLIAGYFRQCNCTLPFNLDPFIVYHLILQYCRKPLLKEIIIQELNKHYNTELGQHFVLFIHQSQWNCNQIYGDITIKNLQSKIVNELSSNGHIYDKHLLHDQLRDMCHGKQTSKFNENASKYFHYLQLLTTHYIKSDGNNGYKIDFNIVICLLTMDIKLEVLVYIYLFAYHWMYAIKKRKRCKLDVCLNQNLQYIFGNVDIMIVPSDLCVKLIDDQRINKSCYFVRSVLNQYLKYTYVPLSIEHE